MGDTLIVEKTRLIFAEFLGTGLLVTAVIGSGIMAQALTSDRGLQLFINAFATITTLGVFIFLFGEVSGAHFNPIVSSCALIRREISPLRAVTFIFTQFAGGLAGTALANGMFKRPLFEASLHPRPGSNVLLGEIVATAGLIVIIFCKTTKNRPMFLLVPAWVGSAYFFTSSTSFANPAVTFARAWSNSFAGISPSSVLPFIGAQLVGGVIGFGIALFLNQQGRVLND